MADHEVVFRVLLATAGFGAMALWAKQAYADGWAPQDLVAARFVLVALAFWAIVALRLAAAGEAARAAQLPPRRVAVAAFVLGLTAYALENHLYFAAVERIDAGLLALIMSVYPLLVVLLSRERLDAQRSAALALALGGAVLVLVGAAGGSFDTLGIMLALGSATAYATYLVAGGRLVRELDPFTLAALVTSGAAVSLTVASGGVSVPDGGAAALDLAGLVVVSSVLPLAFLWLGIAQIGAATASIVASVEPAITVTLAALLLGEHLQDLQLAGGALVVSAVVVLNARVRQREPAPEVPGPTPAGALAGEPA